MQELNRARQEIEVVQTLEKRLAENDDLLELALSEAE
ncbi:MAG TPA: hypothetical protein DDZ55_00830, partial [Firmicutes bacterium]|nr:hypothetical protein [Bacillota bacterium]